MLAHPSRPWGAPDAAGVHTARGPAALPRGVSQPRRQRGAALLLLKRGRGERGRLRASCVCTTCMGVHACHVCACVSSGTARWRRSCPRTGWPRVWRRCRGGAPSAAGRRAGGGPACGRPLTRGHPRDLAGLTPAGFPRPQQGADTCSSPRRAGGELTAPRSRGEPVAAAAVSLAAAPLRAGPGDREKEPRALSVSLAWPAACPPSAPPAAPGSPSC